MTKCVLDKIVELHVREAMQQQPLQQMNCGIPHKTNVSLNAFCHSFMRHIIA